MLLVCLVYCSLLIPNLKSDTGLHNKYMNEWTMSKPPYALSLPKEKYNYIKCKVKVNVFVLLQLIKINGKKIKIKNKKEKSMV